MSVMTHVDNYFDQLVEPMFQRDDQGRELFFPFGMGSRGRVVPDLATGDRVRAAMRRFWIVFFLVWIPVIAVCSAWIPNIWVMLALIAASVGVMWIVTSGISRGLEVVERRMTPSNQFASVLANASLKRLVIMTVLSLALTLAGALEFMLPILQEGQPGWFKPLAAFSALFFGACTVMWAALAVKKWRAA